MPDARPASTVIVLRPAQGAAPELFLVKRHGRSGFFANAYVYPGGGVEPQDAALLRARSVALPAVAARMGCAPEIARAHMIAAAREAFEEAGLLLATSEDGGPLPPDAPLDALRAALNAGELGFEEVLTRLGATLALDALGYIAHWITPLAEPRRFDTRFFVATLPAGQLLAHDRREVVEGAWMTAGAALAAYHAGQIELAPPTIITLEQLRRAASLDAILAWSRSHVSAPVMPALVQDGDTQALVFPGDPLFCGDATPDVALPAARLTLIDGRWLLPA